MSTQLAPSADLPPWAVWLACALALVSLVLLAFELRRRERGGVAIAATGLLAIGALLAAVLRPARVAARVHEVGARVVVLADTSRSMALPAAPGGRTRREIRDEVIARLRQHGAAARLVVLGFGEGEPAPMPAAGPSGTAGEDTTPAARSDLASALRALAASADERPAAVVVVSDGRLDDPPEHTTSAALRSLEGSLRIPIDAVAVATEAPADASVRHVGAAGAAVAHVPIPLRVEVGCAGGLACDEVPITARELRDDGPPSVLATGVARVRDGTASIDLTITLERAGPRIVEVAITAPPGDTIPANDRRLIAFNVTRERVRVLHVAGRPTDDVREFRQWLKSDASVDVVAFFILRTPTDDVRATQSELALIPFPVDELFTEHLPSFDAVVLQDFDAQPYGLEKYLSNLQRYVRAGGGLIMVGGQNSFVAGGYAGTPLADVLPIELDASGSATGADTAAFVPQWTPEGRAAPLLGPLRSVTGDDLPEMPGANVLGDARPGGIVLWSHPTRTTRRGARMPVLAVGDEGDGRSIALGVDGSWRLTFSELGAQAAGRGHGALWDGLLGWLMRDPRFETAQMDLVGRCTAGLPARLRARIVTGAGAEGSAATPEVELQRLDEGGTPRRRLPAPVSTDGATLVWSVPPLEAGAYAARLRVPGWAVSRFDFACEAGGDEWADSRPDAPRLEALASATHGAFVRPADVDALRWPAPTLVSAERHVTPVAPPWLWSFAAAALLGVHWVARRRGGLS